MQRIRGTGRERPSRPVAVVMLVGVIGIAATVVAFLTAPEVGLILFGTLFVGALVWNLVYAGSNIFGSRPIHHTDGEYEATIEPDAAERRSLDFDERLRKLERLREDGLVSEEEYERKRAEILEEKW